VEEKSGANRLPRMHSPHLRNCRQRKLPRMRRVYVEATTCGSLLQQIDDTLADTLRQVADIPGIDPLLWKRYLCIRWQRKKCHENRNLHLILISAKYGARFSASANCISEISIRGLFPDSATLIFSYLLEA